MSKELFEVDGLLVTRHVGPAIEGDDRARWQLTTTNGEGFVVLDRRQLRDLVVVLLGDCWWVPLNTKDV